MAILFENYLWRGNRASKRSADNFNAFKSSNYPQLAKIGLGIYFNNEALQRHTSDRPLNPHYAMDASVMTIDLFPGMTEQTLRHQLATPDIRGIVMRTFGAGNSPTAPWFVEAIRETVERGVIIMNVTQCPNGSVRTIYQSADVLTGLGVISGRDITFEAAITKLMYLLGTGLPTHEVKKYLNTSLCGEMTV